MNEAMPDSAKDICIKASSHVFAEFDVPISQVDKMFPTVMPGEGEADLHKGTPLGPFWFADEMQAGLLRCAIGFTRIALDAGADNVFPGGRPAAVARHHVVEVQIFAVKNIAAVLAGVLCRAQKYCGA